MAKKKTVKPKNEAPVLPPAPTPSPAPKDIGHDLVEEHKHKHHHTLKIAASILAVCFIIVFSVIGYVLTKAPAQPLPKRLEQETVEVAPVIIEEARPAVSIGWLFNNSSITNAGTVSATGYLRSVKEEGQTRYYYFLTDDEANRVEVTGIRGSQISYFTRDGKTLYTVRGIVRKYQTTFQLEAKSIASVD